MILFLVRFMQIGRARDSWQIYRKALARFMDLPALACTSNLHEPHQNKNHSLNEAVFGIVFCVERCWFMRKLAMYPENVTDKLNQ